MCQEEIASGKKLFMYLFDLHIISRKVLRMFPLNKALQLVFYVGRSLIIKNLMNL